MIANAQNICNLIGREECSIDGIAVLVSILHSLTKKNNIRFLWQKTIEIFKIKLISNDEKSFIIQLINH